MDDIDRAIEDLRALLADGITRFADGRLVSVTLAELVAAKSLIRVLNRLDGRFWTVPE